MSEKGIADAEAMEKRASAYERYGSVAVIDMLSNMYKEVLPEIAKNVAEPMSKIGDITIYGNTGQEASGISGNVPLMMKKTMESNLSNTL